MCCKKLSLMYRIGFQSLTVVMIALFLCPPLSLADSEFNHRYPQWEKVLNAYVKEGRVDYQALQKSPDLLDELFQEVKSVSREDYDKWKREEKIAFWLNIYNAAAIKMILAHYPLHRRPGWKALVYPANSIQQIPKVWKRKVVEIFGQPVSLNEIEHEILRKDFEEPRIHFALVCASRGCPVLWSEPFVAERLDAQLDSHVRHFFSNRDKVYYDSKSDTLYLSPIFKWFREDFEKAQGVISFVKSYLPEELGAKISNLTEIEWLDYDWRLNERS